MRPSTLAIAFGAGRALVGVALLAAPAPIARGWVGAEDTPASVLARSLGGPGPRDRRRPRRGGCARPRSDQVAGRRRRRRRRRRRLHPRRRRRHPAATDASPRRRSPPAPRSSAHGSRAPSIDPHGPRRSNTSFVRVAIIGIGHLGADRRPSAAPRARDRRLRGGRPRRRAHEHDPRRHRRRDLARRHRLHRPQRPQLPALRARSWTSSASRASRPT